MKQFLIMCTLLLGVMSDAGYYNNEGQHNLQESNNYNNNENYDVRDYYTYPKYEYKYGVEDSHTGDHKSQWENRDGDLTKGGYTIYDADGTKRTVDYHSNGHNGFSAIVQRIGHAEHPQIYGGQNGFGGKFDKNNHGHTATSYSNIIQHFGHHN